MGGHPFPKKINFYTLIKNKKKEGYNNKKYKKITKFS